MARMPRTARLVCVLLLVCATWLVVAASPDTSRWRGISSHAVRVENGALRESLSAKRPGGVAVDPWVKPFVELEAVAFFKDEDAAHRRWVVWQEKLLHLRTLAAAASEKLSEDKEKEDTPRGMTTLFDNILNAEMSAEAVQQRQTARAEALTGTTLSSALAALEADTAVLRGALAVRHLVTPDVAAASTSPDALFVTLMQEYFPHSFAVAGRTHAPVQSPIAGPFGAVLRRYRLAFPALVDPNALAQLSKEDDAVAAAFKRLLLRADNSTHHSKVIVAAHGHLVQDVSAALTRTAGFVDALDAIARPLCTVAESALARELALIQAALFDPDGRPRGHPDAAHLKLQKSSLRRWRKSVTAFCASRAPALTTRPHASRADGRAAWHSKTKRQADAELFNADAIATALALVAKYRLGDSRGRLALPGGLPDLPSGSTVNGLTLEELRSGVLPVLLYAAAATLVLSLGLFELQMLCLRRVLAERRFAARYAQAVRASPSSSRAAQPLWTPSPFSRRALTVVSAALTLCPWLVALTVIVYQLRRVSVPLSVLPHFVCSPAGLRTVTIALVLWFAVSWLIAGLLRAYAALVRSVQRPSTQKAKAE